MWSGYYGSKKDSDFNYRKAPSDVKGKDNQHEKITNGKKSTQQRDKSKAPNISEKHNEYIKERANQINVSKERKGNIYYNGINGNSSLLKSEVNGNISQQKKINSSNMNNGGSIPSSKINNYNYTETNSKFLNNTKVNSTLQNNTLKKVSDVIINKPTYQYPYIQNDPFSYSKSEVIESNFKNQNKFLNTNLIPEKKEIKENAKINAPPFSNLPNNNIQKKEIKNSDLNSSKPNFESNLKTNLIQDTSSKSSKNDKNAEKQNDVIHPSIMNLSTNNPVPSRGNLINNQIINNKKPEEEVKTKSKERDTLNSINNIKSKENEKEKELKNPPLIEEDNKFSNTRENKKNDLKTNTNPKIENSSLSNPLQDNKSLISNNKVSSQSEKQSTQNTSIKNDYLNNNSNNFPSSNHSEISDKIYNSKKSTIIESNYSNLESAYLEKGLENLGNTCFMY